MSWCVVEGSQAAVNPNVPNPPYPNDVSTNDILMKRYQRATENIYMDKAGISFRSAIGSLWDAGGLRELSFPHVKDPNTKLGIIGDIMDPEVDNTEMNQILNECIDQYSNLHKGDTGVNAINVNLFHFKDGKYIGTVNGLTNQVMYGFGACAEKMSAPTISCSTFYAPFIVMADNHYLMDGIKNRNFPGTTTTFKLTDPKDQAVGHELGHALGLTHRTDSATCMSSLSCTTLMSPSNQDKNKDGKADNIGLNNDEVNRARYDATKVPKLIKDPTNKFLNGDIVETIKAAKILEGNVPAYLDLSLMRVALDTKGNKVSVGQQLLDLIPQGTRSLEYWTLIDRDNNTRTGASANTLQGIGVPPTKFMGADLVTRAEVNGMQMTGKVWQFRNGTLVELPNNSFHFDLLANVGYIDSGPAAGGNVVNHQSAPSTRIPINNIVSVTMNNNITKIGLNKPFNIQAITIQKGLPIADKLDKSKEERGIRFVLEHEAFAQCFTHGEAKAGENAIVDVSGLKPNSKIHGVLGPIPVFDWQTNKTGGGTVHFSIPKNTTDGSHLISIGVDKTAVTADCAVNVKASPAPTSPNVTK